jgi:hypothetical protein
MTYRQTDPAVRAGIIAYLGTATTAAK